MEVLEAIRNRRSIRRFEDTPVEEWKLLNILEAGRLAPSAHNQQPWSFIVVTDPRVKEKLSAACEQDFFITTAHGVSPPVVIVVCAHPGEGWVRIDGEEFWKMDVGIAMQNMALAAVNEGLASCMIVAFREEEVKKALAIRPEERVIALIPIGYPMEKKGPVTNRKPLHEIVRWVT
jgi:nitroreductase